MKQLVAVAVSGKKNLTRITAAHPLSEATLESFTRIVAKKKPNRIYYVVAVDEATWGQQQKDVLLRWHVGEGLTHKEGWWVD